MTVKVILDYLSEKAPLESAEGFDNVGLLTGSFDTEVTGVCCCVDITHDVISEAVEKGANLIISHHPVIFEGLKSIPVWSPVVELIKNDIAVIAMHTNFDIAPKGVNAALVGLLEFESGGCFENGFGAICEMSREFTVLTLAEHCKARLGLQCVKYSLHSEEQKPLRRVAVCCGGGIDRDIMRFSREQNVDAIISGDIKHNFWIEAQNCGIALIDAGHFGTERAAASALAKLVTDCVTANSVIIPVFAAECEHDPCGYIV